WLSNNHKSYEQVRHAIRAFFHSRMGINSHFHPLVFNREYLGLVDNRYQYREKVISDKSFANKWGCKLPINGWYIDNIVTRIATHMQQGSFFDAAATELISREDIEYYLDRCNIEGNQEHIDEDYEQALRFFNQSV
ncbi:MAG TPA: hypothetical protein DHN29_15505, partial [Cytophagales bacterium]|nr:hypothetical protein [Cytophagales bacterium]